MLRGLVALMMVIAGSAWASPIACPSGASVIVVDTHAHRMALCEAGKVIDELPVAIGRAGAGKQREGDRKTPLGAYALEEPRASTKFHTFIGIGYPTPAQASRGLTGGAVGIHGPSRRLGWLGAMRTWVDWTDGCIAVESDDAIVRVATWMSRAKVHQVEIQ